MKHPMPTGLAPQFTPPAAHRFIRPIWCMLGVALLFTHAQAAPPLDGGVQGLQAEVQVRLSSLLGPAAAPLRIASPSQSGTDDVTRLLQAPLDGAAAMRIALLHNPVLQMALGTEGSGITDLQGPGFPARLRASDEATRLALRAFKAWVNAMAAQRSAELLRDAKTTAETADELTRRMVRAGNVSRLTQAQSQATLSDAAVALARGEQAAFTAREQLVRVLGLWGTQTGFSLAKSLPALPTKPPDDTDLEVRAVAARSSLQTARLAWQRKLATTVPATMDERWDALGDAARVRADAVQVRSEAREAAFNLRTQWDIAHHLQTEVLPLRQFIHEELTLRYNGMLTSVLEVLADSRTRTLATLDAADALRDYWLAFADVQAVLAGVSPEGGKPAGTGAPSGATPQAAH
jgi:multidrug efflux system outer membrane protein